MAGRIADGVVMEYCVPVDYNDIAIEQLMVGLKVPAAAWKILTAAVGCLLGG